MGHEREERRRMERYILGELTEEEQERMEIAYFLDPSRMAKLWSVFDEMARNYLRGRMPLVCASKFEHRLASSPALNRRVRKLAASREENDE